jgi:hypothetical protein
MSSADYQRVGADYERLAETGDPAAMVRLAELAEHGWRGVEQDAVRALQLLRRAAELGSAVAACRLGDRYYRGQGVSQSEPDALDWYRRAAAAGDVSAMANLIPLHESADPQLAQEGRRWLAEAASAGEPYALNTLKQLGSGNDKKATLADFARTALEAIAAKAAPGGDELELELEEVTASLEQMNQLVGSWIESLRDHWPELLVVARANDAAIDFPAPDVSGIPEGVLDDNDTIELTIRAGVRHVTLDLTSWDEGWTLTLGSFEPHPAGDEQRAIADSLRTRAATLGIRLPRV